MAVVYHEIYLPIDTESTFDYIVIKQGDAGTHRVRATLISNNRVYTIPTSGASYFMKFRKPDNNYCLVEATVSDNTISAEVTEEMLRVSGTGRGEFMIVSGSDELKTATFHVKIVKETFTSGDVQSHSDFAPFAALLQGAGAAASNANTAAAAANAAASLAEQKAQAIPDDYSDLVAEVEEVKADLGAVKVCAKESDDNDFDAVLADKNGNVLCEFSDGHIKTKKFDSANTSGDLTTKNISDNSDAFYIADTEGNVIAELAGGYWRSKRFIGKKIAILGDSISTFNGFSPSNWNPYYPKAASGVNALSQMWYEIAAKQLGATVLTSASWGGSQVSGDSQDSTSSAMCSTARINALTKNGVEPDIIIIFGGTNDWRANKALGSFDFASELPAEGTVNVFSDAYGLMMHKIMSTYPQAKVYCCTVSPRITDSDSLFPIKNTNNNTLAEFNDEIRKIAKMFGANIIDFDQCGMTIYNTATYTVDNLHPNADGQKLLADEAIRDMLK